MGMEIEDDVIFADLSKQIALLIMDDDDEEEFPVQTPPVVHVQGFHYMDDMPPQVAMMPPPYMYEMTYRSRESCKGTGVFIPRSSIPRKKNRSTGNSSWNSQKHLQKSRIPLSRATNNDSLHSNNYCKSSGSLKNRT